MSDGPTPEPIARLIEAFHKLPGIGPKSAQRLTYHVLRAPEHEAEALSTAILDVKHRISLCDVCLNITETNCTVLRSQFAMEPPRHRPRIAIASGTAICQLFPGRHLSR